MELTVTHHNDLANAIRALSMDAVEQAQSGHPGMPMGMADVATVLFTRFLKYDSQTPDWPDRDRFVLSAGHGSMLLYSLLHLTGYDSVSLDDIKNFRQFGSSTPGHPEYRHTAGVETTTGPLGQGLATAVGMALAERHLAAKYGSEIVDHRTYVIASDGDLMEGVSHEAGALAGHLGLGRLIVLYDDNGISIDGPTSLSMSDDHQARFRSYGWDVRAVDGHDPEAVAKAIEAAIATPQPSLIACRTTIAFGAPKKAGTAASHGSPLGKEEIQGAREQLGWRHDPFVLPNEVVSAWREAGRRGAPLRAAWQERLNALPATVRSDFARRISGKLPPDFDAAVADLKKSMVEKAPKLATRQSSQLALESFTAAVPEIVGGSADLSGSNGTVVAALPILNREDYGGRYIHYGVREHGMAAAMNGMALHGGVIPYGGTFLVFTDYCRPAIRLAALMGVRSIFVMTHDSIGLGEDGPTHQPIEHLASLRAMPNVHLFRPADAVEVAECWALALATVETPSVLALTRQSVPPLRHTHVEENLCARGAYVIAPSNGKPEATIYASGSEVAIAVQARDRLQGQGIPTQVVSVPCWELFDEQPPAYREQIIDRSTVRVAVEAASPFGWERFVGEDGAVVGISTFGASAPAEKLYDVFGVTAENVVQAVLRRASKA